MPYNFPIVTSSEHQFIKDNYFPLISKNIPVMLNRLPAYKDLIVRSINSCITPDQLNVCLDFIQLFRVRYQGWINEYEFHFHLSELEDAYIQKAEILLERQTI